MKKRRLGPWEQAERSSQQAVGSGVLEAACLEGTPQECKVRAVSAAVLRGPIRPCGGDLEEEEGGGPSVLEGGGEACLCDEMLPGEEK